MRKFFDYVCCVLAIVSILVGLGAIIGILGCLFMTLAFSQWWYVVLILGISIVVAIVSIILEYNIDWCKPSRYEMLQQQLERIEDTINKIYLGDKSKKKSSFKRKIESELKKNKKEQ